MNDRTSTLSAPPQPATATGVNAGLHATKRRLLDAAGPIFAADGYDGASVRAICSQAGANIAAIKYHFGHKLGLYQAVLRSASGFANERYPYPTDLDPATRLTGLVRTLMARVLDSGRPAWHTRLMSREMTDPSPSFVLIVEESARPVMEVLEQAVRDLLPAASTVEEIRLHARSVLGQCMFYRHAAPLLRHLNPDEDLPGSIDAIAGHIARFSLAGLSERRHAASGSIP